MRRIALLCAGLVPVVLGLLGCSARPAEIPGPRCAPSVIRPELARADALRRAGREEEAVEVYARVLQEDPASVPAHLRYLGTLLQLGRRSEARRIYRERCARPEATEADLTMSHRLETDGSSSALRRIYTLAAERSSGIAWWRLALAEIEIAEAEAWNRRRLDALGRGDRAEETKAFEQARAALARGADALEDAAAVGPTLAEVDLYRGYLRAVEGDVHLGAVARAASYRAAEAAFARAVARDPDLVEAWEGLGDVRSRTGATTGSLTAYVEAVTRSPADPRLRESLGVVLQTAGRHSEAAEQYREAALLAPRDPSPWLRLGDAYAEDERWEKALQAYAEGLRRDGSVIEAWYKQATVFEHLGRLGEARGAYERYLSQGGERSGTVRRRVERLLRVEESPPR